jgi:hypothetical protein
VPESRCASDNELDEMMVLVGRSAWCFSAFPRQFLTIFAAITVVNLVTHYCGHRFDEPASDLENPTFAQKEKVHNSPVALTE